MHSFIANFVLFYGSFSLLFRTVGVLIDIVLTIMLVMGLKSSAKFGKCLMIVWGIMIWIMGFLSDELASLLNGLNQGNSGNICQD